MEVGDIVKLDNGSASLLDEFGVVLETDLVVPSDWGRSMEWEDQRVIRVLLYDHIQLFHEDELKII